MADRIDEFESLFKRAEREPFGFSDVPLQSAVLIADCSRDAANKLRETVVAFASRLESIQNWRIFAKGDFANVTELLEKVDEEQTDLIVTSRHLHESAIIPQHSLGVYVDVLTQATSIPVFLLPGTAAHPVSLAGRQCQRILIATDHISADHRLIHYGVRFCPPGGTVWLCHAEDDLTFERYMRAIERIPEIHSQKARELIDAQLRKEAEDFMQTCVAELRENGPNASYKSIVSLGHHVKAYKRWVEDHGIDLLVANTKDEDQLAMHGMTYSLSVELIDVPMLLL